MATDADAKPADDRSPLAALLRTWRERALLTQEQLAGRTGLGVRTIRRLEADGMRRPHGGSVRSLADALDLTDAERALLIAAARGDPVPRQPAAPRGARQLPADVAGFAGRTEQLRHLDTLLAGAGTATATVISAIAGTAGVGKTALAVHWAHRVADRFPDGQLYVNLRGFDPGGSAVSPAEAVRGFLDALDVPPPRIPATLPAQTALYRSLLANQHVLVVLDNARDAEQVRPLLPGAPGCMALVTSRSQLSSLVAAEGAHPLTLDLLSTVEAGELLARRLGAHRVSAEPQAVNEIITLCAQLPLALSIAAARAATHPDFPLAALAGELRDACGGLDAFDGEDPATDLRAVFSWSYRHLGAPAARLFRLLGLHAGPDIAGPAAASLAGITLARVRPPLAELTRTCLLTEHAPGRYTFHDLLRTYAAELANTMDPEAERRAALHRILDHYLSSARSAALCLEPHRDPITVLPPDAGVTPEDFADHNHALAWFGTERRVLLAHVERAAQAGLDTHTWQLAWTVAGFVVRRGHWRDWATTQDAALRAARRLADRPRQASAQMALGGAHTAMGHHNDGRAHVEAALELYQELGDLPGQARAHTNLAKVCERQGQHDVALAYALRALDLARTADYRSGRAIILNTVGWAHAQLGDYRQALTYCRQALALHNDLGHRDGAANTLDSLGYIHHHLGHHQEAIDCYQEALDIWRGYGDVFNQADALVHLGDTHHAAGDLDSARDNWQHALDILDELDHPNADRVRTRLRQLDTPSARRTRSEDPALIPNRPTDKRPGPA